MSWNPKLAILIGITTLVSYISAIVIEKSKSKKIKKLSLVISISISLGILFFYKYFNFFSSTITSIVNRFGIPFNGIALKLLLPVGISFYTFQTLSYSIDVYRGDIKAEQHLGYFALYVSFFPQLVAGPIERPENLLPQLRNKTKINPNNIKIGLKYMLAGFFKKVVVADTLAVVVNQVYNNPSNSNGLSITIATILFAIQILCDFDGYTTIAIGVAKTMNIDLMKNFNSPYSALTIKEFWARWHISLSSWFKDYVYIPLGGNRVSKPRHLFNLFITFLLSGLWHGASWTFVIWGALHGLYLILEDITKNPLEKLKTKLNINQKSDSYKLFKKIVVFLLVGFAWIFFRANNVGDAFVLIRNLFTDWRFDLSFYSGTLEKMQLTVPFILFMILSVYTISILNNSLKDKSLYVQEGKQNFSIAVVTNAMNILIVSTIMLTWIYLVSQTGYDSSFIYFQF